MNSHSLALEVNRSVLCHDIALNLTPRPEKVLHVSPWLRWVRPKCARAVLASPKAGCGQRELDIDERLFVGGGLDGVRLSIFAQIHRAAIGLEVVLVLGEAVVAEII